jgi:Ca2+-binding RTX toxin-like protein
MKGRTGRLVRRSSLGLLVAMAMLIALPSGASAATQIGQTFTPTAGIPAGNTWLQPAAPGAQYTVPSAGVITSWSFEADGAPPEIKFKVGRPAPGADFMTQVDFTIVGESSFVTPVANQLNTYPVQIPVQAGDAIGLAGAEATAGFWVRLDSDYPYHVASGDVAAGTTETFDPSGNAQFDLSANLETTPCKGRRPTMAGTSDKDTLTGTPGPDVIIGLEGTDKINGRGGNDRICGAEGKDKLKGGAGKDKLAGQKGRDKLNGGVARDVCNGGKGDDSASKCEVEKSI